MSFWNGKKTGTAPHPEPSDDALLLHHLIGQLEEVTNELIETAMIMREQVKPSAQGDKGQDVGSVTGASGSSEGCGSHGA